MSTLRDDELSRRVFYGGLLGLPWLWIVHTLGYYTNKHSDEDGLLNDPNEPGSATAAATAYNQQVWVKRCQCAAFVVTLLWLVWVFLVQFYLTDQLPDSLFVRTPDQGEYTGW